MKVLYGDKLFQRGSKYYEGPNIPLQAIGNNMAGLCRGIDNNENLGAESFIKKGQKVC